MARVIPDSGQRKPVVPHSITARWPKALIPRRMRLYTILVVALAHAIAIVATLAFAKLQDFILSSPQLRADFDQPGSPLIYFFRPVQWTCYVAATCHALTLGHILLLAIKRACSKQKRVLSKVARMNRFASVMLTGQGPNAQLLAETAWWKRLKLFLSTVTTTNPAEVAQVRLLLEITLQTFQANKMSRLVVTVWINRLLAFVIVANCWFTPIVYAVLKHQSQFLIHVVRLITDTLLDATYCFGIPLAILYPYMVDFDPLIGSFPYDNFVMDAWTAVAAAETKQVFVSSWLDFISKTSPWFFFCYRLFSLRQLVTSRESHTKMKPSAAVKAASRVARVLNGVLVAWGFAVLAVHLHVSWATHTTTTSLGCLMELRPWLKTSRTCTVVEISCSQRGITGRQEEIAAALAEVDASEIQSLIFSHCPAFEMPPVIRSLTNVAMFKFYNTTVQEWSQQAALTEATNGNVQQLYAIETNFTAFPEGLLSPHMSETLRDVKFISTNLAALPAALTEAFRGVKYFVIEDSPLMEFPESVARLPNVMFVSMGSDGISSIPPFLLQNLKVRQIRFVNNPLTVIPAVVGQHGQVLSLVVKNTRVDSLPASWLATKDDTSLGVFIVEAQNTPLCDRLQSGELSATKNGQQFTIGRFLVRCDDIYGFYQNISYPIDKERLWRQANRVPTLSVA